MEIINRQELQRAYELILSQNTRLDLPEIVVICNYNNIPLNYPQDHLSTFDECFQALLERDLDHLLDLLIERAPDWYIEIYDEQNASCDKLQARLDADKWEYKYKQLLQKQGANV